MQVVANELLSQKSSEALRKLADGCLQVIAVFPPLFHLWEMQVAEHFPTVHGADAKIFHLQKVDTQILHDQDRSQMGSWSAGCG